MRSGSADQGPGRGSSARLVPQADGYAEYVDPAREPSRPVGPGQHRSPARRPAGQAPTRNIQTGSFRIKGVPSSATRRRQRSIRSTIAWLLVLPVITMIGLYGYAVAGTIGPAIAKQSAATVNVDVGAPDQLLGEALDNEQSDTFIWQASHHLAPNINLQRDYAATDKYVSAFTAGISQAGSALPVSAQAAAVPLINILRTRTQLRAEAQTSTTNELQVFQGYLAIQNESLVFSNSLANPNASIQENEQTEGLIAAGGGIGDMADVSTLLGGVVAGGGYMTPGEYQLFAQLYYGQVGLFKIVNDPLLWRVSPDPYYQSSLGAGAMNSPQVVALLALEHEVFTDGSAKATVRLPITPAQLQEVTSAAFAPTGPLVTAEQVSRLGITANDNHQGDVILWRLAIVGGVGLFVVVLSAVLLWRFARRITRELTGLRGAAQTLAGERLPSVVRRLRAGDDVDVDAEAPPLNLGTKTREVTETADSFAAVQRTAVEAAVEQALLRKGVSNVFRSLARRNQSLLQRQLKMLDEMERGTQDPDALSQLFRLDHLTTRMRRQAEGLIILSGAAPGRRWRQPVPIVEVLRGAISEIEDYVRVDLVTDSSDFLAGSAVADVTHLLAELIENAVVYSPPATRVQVRGGRVANGYVVEVEDRGLGIPPATRDQINERLAQPPEFDLADSDQLGLFVVSRLAIRNEIRVSLRESGFGGTTAIVLLPGTLVVSEDEARTLTAQGARGAIGAGVRPTNASGATAVPTASRRAPRFDRPASAADEPRDAGLAGDPFRDDAYARGSAGSGSFGTGSYGARLAGNGSPGYEPAGNDSSYDGATGNGSLGGGSFGGGSSGYASPDYASSDYGSSDYASSDNGSADYAAPDSGPTGSYRSGGGQPAGGGSFGGRSAFGGPPAGGAPSTGNGSFGGSAFGGSAFGGSPSGGEPSLPTRGGGRGAFGNPAPFQDAPAPAAPFSAAGDGGGQSEGVGPAGLPRRQKMASLAPQLRENRPEAPQGPMVGRSPEQARALLSSIQRGLRTGRDSGLPGDPRAGDQDDMASGNDGDSR